jgi:PAS domain S-box-containing protein
MSRKRSLGWMVALGMVSSMAPMIFALSYWHYEMEYDDLRERTRLKGQIAMDGFAGLIEAGVVNHEQATLKQAVRSVSLFPCFSRALGVDKDKKVFVSSWGGVGESLGRVDAKIASNLPQTEDAVIRFEHNDSLISIYRKISAPEIYEMGSPMAGGWLYIELDLHQDLAKLQEVVIRHSLMVAVVVIGFSLALWFWLSRRLTRPLMHMAQTVSNAGSDLSGISLGEEACCFELNELAKGFALMAKVLALHYATLERQRMLYHALSKTNQAVVHSVDEERLITDVCEAVVSAGIRLVWIGYVDKVSGDLSIAYTAGEDSGWLATVRKHIGIDQDPLVALMRQGEEGVVRITEALCSASQWYAEARLNGFAVGACFPIYRNEAFVGGLAVMSDDEALLDNDGMLLLREMASDIGFALSNLDRLIIRRRMEENLARERSLLRTLVDTIPDVIFFKDLANSYMGCNQAFEEMLALQEAKLVGGTDQDIFLPELSKVLHEQDKRILSGGIGERNQVCVDKPDGSRVILDLLKAPFLDANGAVIGLVGIGRDVTSESKIRQDLEQALAVLQRAESISKIGTWSFDPDTQVMRWSELIYQLLDYDPKEITPGFDRLAQRCHQDDQEAVVQSLEKLKKGDIKDFTLSYRVLLPGGELRYLVGRGSISNLKDQHHARIIGTIQDVTQQHEAEESQKRTLDSVRSQQRQALIGDLTASVLHELNDVMTPILGFSKLATDHNSLSDESLRGYLEHIHEAAARGGKLLSRLTALIQSRQYRASESIDLLPLSMDAVDLLKAALPTTLHIQTQFATSLPKVEIDPGDFKQIFLTLALRVKDEIGGKGKLLFTLRTLVPNEMPAGIGVEGQSKSFVELNLEGVGDPQTNNPTKMLDQEPAEQVEEDGLSPEIVRMLLKLYAGVLEADAVPGEFLRFRLFFPVSEELGAAPDKAAQPMLSKDVFGEGKRVLLVDDDEAVTLYLQEFLQLLGFEVEVFTESRLALECFLRNPRHFDMLITDQIMPGMDGLQLIASLHEVRRDLPVILCSGYSEKVSLANAADYGVDAFLQKPVSLDDIAQAIKYSLRIIDE